MAIAQNNRYVSPPRGKHQGRRLPELLVRQIIYRRWGLSRSHNWPHVLEWFWMDTIPLKSTQDVLIAAQWTARAMRRMKVADDSRTPFSSKSAVEVPPCTLQFPHECDNTERPLSVEAAFRGKVVLITGARSMACSILRARENTVTSSPSKRLTPIHKQMCSVELTCTAMDSYLTTLNSARRRI